MQVGRNAWCWSDFGSEGGADHNTHLHVHSHVVRLFLCSPGEVTRTAHCTSFHYCSYTLCCCWASAAFRGFGRQRIYNSTVKTCLNSDWCCHVLCLSPMVHVTMGFSVSLCSSSCSMAQAACTVKHGNAQGAGTDIYLEVHQSACGVVLMVARWIQRAPEVHHSHTHDALHNATAHSVRVMWVHA